jgi:hypothetical protein
MLELIKVFLEKKCGSPGDIKFLNLEFSNIYFRFLKNSLGQKSIKSTAVAEGS